MPECSLVGAREPANPTVRALESSSQYSQNSQNSRTGVIRGDFREASVLAQLVQAMDGRKADVVVSDMAPNLSGIGSADTARIAHLQG